MRSELCSAQSGVRRVAAGLAGKESQNMAWTLRLRGAKNGATNVELPHGATTSLQELKAAVATAVGEDAGTLVIKAGFPPRELSEDGGPYAAVSGDANERFMVYRTRSPAFLLFVSLCSKLFFLSLLCCLALIMFLRPQLWAWWIRIP